MTLGEQQRVFTRNVAKLIEWAYANGFELTFGRAYDPPEQNAAVGGLIGGLHTKRLAIDFNLFKNGIWLMTTEAHAPLGAFWKSLHPANRWGGDFKSKPDGNHYSMEWEGVK